MLRYISYKGLLIVCSLLFSLMSYDFLGYKLYLVKNALYGFLKKAKLAIKQNPMHLYRPFG